MPVKDDGPATYQQKLGACFVELEQQVCEILWELGHASR
jgi:hypothetical protein